MPRPWPAILCVCPPADRTQRQPQHGECTCSTRKRRHARCQRGRHGLNAKRCRGAQQRDLEVVEGSQALALTHLAVDYKGLEAEAPEENAGALRVGARAPAGEPHGVAKRGVRSGDARSAGPREHGDWRGCRPRRRRRAGSREHNGGVAGKLVEQVGKVRVLVHVRHEEVLLLQRVDGGVLASDFHLDRVGERGALQLLHL